MNIARIRSAMMSTIIGIFFCCTMAEAACEDGLPLSGIRDDVLIIINDNSKDSCEVATHYALARGLGKKNIVHVRTPADFFMDWTQFIILRDQIINRMQQQVKEKDPSFVPNLCTGSSPYYCQQAMDQLRSRSTVRYIVTTRGVPTRVKVDNSSYGEGPTSVDNYLKYWLINFFDSDVSFSALSAKRVQAFGDGSGMRIVDPHNDQELIVGRLDGLSMESANNLVDRALSAEQKGVYGKLYGNANQTNSIYGDPSTSWRWQFGLFHETNPLCFDYTQPDSYMNFAHFTEKGRSPTDCSVRMCIGAAGYSDDPPPGDTIVYHSRIPDPINGLVYLGNLDGQATGYNYFSNFLNWRRDSACTNTLCENATDPAACRQASVDIFKEIDTRCVGVADGFIGYNFQSFPLSYLNAAPNGWTLPMLQDYGGNGDLYRAGLPIVRTDTGYDDLSSLWFYNTDQIASPVCFANSTFGAPATQVCLDEKFIKIEQALNIQQPHKSVSGNPDRYRVRLHYSTTALSQPTNITVRAFIERDDVTYNFNFNDVLMTPQISSGTMGTADNPSWSQYPAEAIITLDPAMFPGNGSIPKWDGNYSNLRLWIFTDQNSTFTGAIGLDAISVKQIDQNGNEISGELIQNGSFANGHQQSSVGDFAAGFLSRLNGTAFWGSVSHHESRGRSFSSHPLQTLTYFLRGLPLGDAVWFAEPHNSGVLYGDPLYSPVAVRLQTAAPVKTGQQTTLAGSALNGSDPNQVTTQYMVEYCSGDDFFVCNQQQSWLSTGISGQGGQRNMVFGNWDTTGLTPGMRTLRLSVTSTNNVTGAQQTFSDHAKVLLYDDLSDADEDDLKDAEEIALGTDPLKPDSDKDGLTDNEEVKVYKTNPLNTDTDGDGLGDWGEITYGRNPLIPEFQWKSIVNMISWTEYDSLARAVAEAGSGDVIRIKSGAVVAVDNLVLDKDITIEGGYDDIYEEKTGSMVSTIRGQVQTDNGAATLSDILIDYAAAPSHTLTTQTSNATLTGAMVAGSTVTITATTNATVGLIALTTPTIWSGAISGLAPGDNVFTITVTSPTGVQTVTTTTVSYVPAPVPAMSSATVLLAAALLLLITRRLQGRATPDASR